MYKIVVSVNPSGYVYCSRMSNEEFEIQKAELAEQIIINIMPSGICHIAGDVARHTHSWKYVWFVFDCQ